MLRRGWHNWVLPKIPINRTNLSLDRYLDGILSGTFGFYDPFDELVVYRRINFGVS
jgi:hypothetical protein